MTIALTQTLSSIFVPGNSPDMDKFLLWGNEIEINVSNALSGGGGGGGVSSVLLDAEILRATTAEGLLVPISAIVNDVTTGGVNVPLSAEMGKTLNTLATGMLPRSGASAMLGNLLMGGFVIAGLAAGSAAGHSARYDELILRPVGVASAAKTSIGAGGTGSAITSGVDNILYGVNCGSALTIALSNIAIGKDCISSSQATIGNIAIGFSVMKNLGEPISIPNTVASTTFNIGIGYRTLEVLSQGYENICIGNNVGLVATTAIYATIIGSEAGRYLTSGINNAGYGVVALHGVTSGSGNVGFGGGTGMDANGLITGQVGCLAVTTGSYNTFLGHAAQTSATNQPNYMTVIGSGAKGNKDNTVFIGRAQDFVNIGYSQNTARLSISGQNSTNWPLINLDFTGNLAATPLASANAGDVWYSPGGNDASKSLVLQIKSNAVYGLVAGTNVPVIATPNTIDYQALLSGVRTFGPAGFNGNYNLFIGKGCGNTTMGGTTSQGTANICIGIGVGTSISTGSSNFLFGAGSVTSGNNNTIIGQQIGVTTGSNNLIAGIGVGAAMAGASGNVILAGNNSVSLMTSGVNSVYIGNVVCNAMTTGGQNVVIGYGSGSTLVSSNNCIIGYATGAGLTSGGGNTIIGGLITGITSSTTNTMILSHSGTSTLATALLVADAISFRPASPIKSVKALVAGLPSPVTAGQGTIHYATNGRKAGEGAGAGTGCPVHSNGTEWLTFYDNTAIAA